MEGHPNCIIGLKVKAILLNGLILPIGGVASVKGLRYAFLKEIPTSQGHLLWSGDKFY